MTKTMKSFSLLLTLAAFAALFIATPLLAGEKLDPKTILDKMDKFVSGYDDQYMEVTMEIIDTDGSSKSYDLNMWQKGDKKRLIRFTSGEVKGMATLILDNDNMWIYLPGYKRVRRVAAHNMNQSFAGSDFSNNDMASATWANLWKPTIKEETDEFYVLDCTPIDAKKVDYARAVVWVGKKYFSQDKIEYYNDKGEKVKIYSNTEMKDWGNGVMRHSIVIMEDARTGHKTKLHVKSMKLNSGLSDSLFSKRQLQWGR